MTPHLPTPSRVGPAEKNRPWSDIASRLPAHAAPRWSSPSRGVPPITIAIPAYNRPALLRQTLASLAAQEPPADFEVVVSDDLGLPATRRVVEACGRPGVRHHVNPRPLGAVRNWNRCLELATGRWVMILHEDDLLYPWCLARMVPHLRPSSAAVAIRCACGPVPPTLPRPLPGGAARRYDPAYFLKSPMTPFPGVLMSRELGRRIGGFDPRWGPLADYEFWYRLACHGPVELLPETGAFYRIHGDQWTAAAWPEMLRKAHLLRLRIVREQFPASPRWGRWLARFFTGRNARAYARRFASRPAVLVRAQRFRRIPFHGLPSGWVWRILQTVGSRPAVPSGAGLTWAAAKAR